MNIPGYSRYGSYNPQQIQQQIQQALQGANIAPQPQSFENSAPNYQQFLQGLPPMQQQASLFGASPQAGNDPTDVLARSYGAAATRGPSISQAMQQPQSALPQGGAENQMTGDDVKAKLAALLAGG